MKNPKGGWKTFLSSGAMGLLREQREKSGNRGASVDVGLLLRERLGALAKNSTCHRDHQRKTDQTFYLIWTMDSSSRGETGWLRNIHMEKWTLNSRAQGLQWERKLEGVPIFISKWYKMLEELNQYKYDKDYNFCNFFCF